MKDRKHLRHKSGFKSGDSPPPATKEGLTQFNLMYLGEMGTLSQIHTNSRNGLEDDVSSFSVCLRDWILQSNNRTNRAKHSGETQNVHQKHKSVFILVSYGFMMLCGFSGFMVLGIASCNFHDVLVKMIRPH